jgi:hypothetical protein
MIYAYRCVPFNLLQTINCQQVELVKIKEIHQLHIQTAIFCFFLAFLIERIITFLWLLNNYSNSIL